MLVRDSRLCASGFFPCMMAWLKQSFVISEAKFDCSCSFPDVPVSLIFITEIVDASNNIFSTLVLASLFYADDLLLNMPVFVGFGHGGAAAVRIII